MQEDLPRKHPIDKFKGNLEDFKGEIEDAEAVYGTQNPDLLSNLSQTKESISGVLEALKEQESRGVDEFNDYLDEKRKNSL